MKTATQGAKRTRPGSLEALIPSWQRSLRATRRSPRTIDNYTAAADQFVAFLVEHGMPTDASKITREHVESFLVDLFERRSPATVGTRYRGLQQLFRWAQEEGEVADSPMRNMRPPTIPETPTPVLGEAELRRLLKTVAGRRFEERRDNAIIRLLLDTGMRRAEVTGLRVEDIDWTPDDVHGVLGRVGDERAVGSHHSRRGMVRRRGGDSRPHGVA